MYSFLFWVIAIGVMYFNSRICALYLDTSVIRTKCTELVDKANPKMMLEYLISVEKQFGSLNIDNELPSLYNYRGVAFHEMNKIDEAGDSFNLAVKYQPSDLRAWINLVEIRQMRPSAGSFEEAMTIVENMSGLKSLMRLFTTVNWHNMEEHVSKQESSMSACILSQSTEICQNSLISGVSMTGLNGTAQRDLFALLFSDLSSTVILKSDSRLSASSKDSIVTVGFIVSQIDGGPVSMLTQDLFKRFDQNRFRVMCFLLQSSDNLQHQWQRDLLVSFGSQNVISLQGLTSDVAAAVISSFHTDVLVDMNGLSLQSGLLIMSHRPSPVQMSFLGDPYTSGVTFIDYFVSDALATPPDITASHFTEKLLLLSSCYLVNSHAEWLPSVLTSIRYDKSQLIREVHDSHLYLNSGGDRYFDPSTSVLMGAFHGFVKVDPTIMDVWTNVLRRCSGEQQCYLVMNNNKVPSSMKNLQHVAQYHGVSSHNLLFLNQSSWDEHVTRKSALDLFLDTILKNGHTTTVDAIYAGLPVIGIKGMSAAHQRSTESLTHFARSDAGMTFSLKQYEDLAVQLTATGRGRRRLSVWRSHVERMRSESSLFDTQYFADSFADLLQVTVELHDISDRLSACEGCNKNKTRFHVFASNVRL